MKRILISEKSGNWLGELADSIEMAGDGDIIEVRSQSAKELGERALARMYPGKKVTFEIGGVQVRYTRINMCPECGGTDGAHSADCSQPISAQEYRE